MGSVLHEGDRGDRPSVASYTEIEDAPDFRELRRRFRGFAFPVTAFFLTWYLLYIIASIWARGFMNNKVLGNINVAYIFGILQFVSTFAIALIYWRHADRNLDPLAERIRNDLERNTAAAAARPGAHR